jgi:hypothetical protein
VGKGVGQIAASAARNGYFSQGALTTLIYSHRRLGEATVYFDGSKTAGSAGADDGDVGHLLWGT